MFRHLSTSNISSKSMHTFLTNLAKRQTDKRTRAETFTSFVGGNYNWVTTQKPRKQLLKTTNIHKTERNETKAWFRSPFTPSAQVMDWACCTVLGASQGECQSTELVNSQWHKYSVTISQGGLQSLCIIKLTVAI